MKKNSYFLIGVVSLLVSACGGGSDDSISEPIVDTFDITNLPDNENIECFSNKSERLESAYYFQYGYDFTFKINNSLKNSIFTRSVIAGYSNSLGSSNEDQTIFQNKNPDDLWEIEKIIFDKVSYGYYLGILPNQPFLPFFSQDSAYRLSQKFPRPTESISLTYSPAWIDPRPIMKIGESVPIKTTGTYSNSFYPTFEINQDVHFSGKATVKTNLGNIPTCHFVFNIKDKDENLLYKAHQWVNNSIIVAFTTSQPGEEDPKNASTKIQEATIDGNPFFEPSIN